MSSSSSNSTSAARARVRDAFSSCGSVDSRSFSVFRFGEAGKVLVATAKQACTDGIHAALLTAAAVLAVAAVVVLLRSPSGPAADPGAAHRTSD